MDEQDFEDRILANFDEAENLIGYSFTGVRELILDYGAVETAKMLLTIDGVLKQHGGFQVLAAHDLEHLSVEQAVIDFADTTLFTAAEIGTAKARLALHKRKKDRDQGAA